MTTVFTDAAAEIAKSAVKDAIAKLAKRYKFDPVEAENELLGGGVQVKKEVIPRNALPWCGEVIEENCDAIAYNSGRYTQCPQQKKTGRWCTKCAKQVEIDGTPKNGDVEQRKACDLMEYTVGERRVVPYGDYMKRNNYTRQEVEDSAAFYGWTVDPRQFECKRRGRPTTNPLHMVVPVHALPEPESEPVPAAAEQRPPLPSPEPAPTLPAAVLAPVPAVPAPVQRAELEEGELDEEEVEEDEEDAVTAEQIDAMPIGDCRKLAESKGIPTKENGKNIGVANLRKILRDHFKV